MPKVEVYGAQPPIELLRQFADAGGWYDCKGLVLNSLVDLRFVAAMAPPGGGRHAMTTRCELCLRCEPCSRRERNDDEV